MPAVYDRRERNCDSISLEVRNRASGLPGLMSSRRLRVQQRAWMIRSSAMTRRKEDSLFILRMQVVL